MENQILLWGLVGVQVVLVLLDLAERRWFSSEGPKRPASRGAMAFLLIVTIVFGLVQFTGMALLPKTEEIFSATQSWFSPAARQTSESDPLRGWPLFVVSVVAFFVAGFWDYLVHRCLSHSRWLWFTHEYHHLPRQIFTAMPGILVRPFAAIPALLTVTATSITMYALLSVFGMPLWNLSPLLPVVGVIAIVLTASHSSCLRRWPIVHHVMKWLGLTTPHEHVLHHTHEMDGNFGNFTTVWDRLFGTYQQPFREEYRQRALGLAYDQDFLGTLTFGRWKLPTALRARFQIGRYCNVDSSSGSFDSGKHAA